MTDKLLQEAFRKAATATGKNSINGRAEYIAEYLWNKFRYQISSKSIVRYYKGESTPNQEILKYLAAFLGYEDYQDYILANAAEKERTDREKLKIRNYVPQKSLTILLLLIPIIGISAYVGYKSGKEKCIIWKEDHYEEATCTGAALEKEYNLKLLENFRKVEVADTTSFFKNGEVQIWYDKNNNKIDYFTAPGFHPENGKTLKPITEYMIEKYVRE